MKRTVIVWDTPVALHVSRTYSTVWVAVGEYRGQRIEAKGRSEVQAATAWRDTAKSKGNRNER